MDKPSKQRAALSLIIAVCGGALLYAARSGIVPPFSDKPILMASTTCAMIMIGAGVGNLFRRPIIGALFGVGLYAAYIAHCAMTSCVPNN